ncbi:saccharopine dehydrogenase NADP-binding domain-containing protein [Sporohalobacter salinus]|uniref:saccharopine dehydrogenase NADP-binding domain-containing protein n=1 Tax=Sporohalobacter salinus TaxID=1494606 RepID=UPI001960B6E4|nr:saccharopine dehydrogenase NADP-binding domain-containing protein [Sporohalobacter salinus]MBM7624102.1 saccharopine dehydrogenase-like NADP-dependent oxidoreductase [Sporohalobacter salinus]
MKDKILVVGGYGKVGRVICRDLGKKFPGKVIAGGRNYKKAKKFAKTTNGNVSPLELDVNVNPKKNNILEGVSIVIMCIDQKNIQFIKCCLRKGVNYIDITASYNFLSEVELLHNTAKSSGVTAILSVGLSPGLTNLLVQYSKNHFDVLEKVDISVILGLGEEHGKAAVEWMIDNINTTFQANKNGTEREIKSFTDGKKVDFFKTESNRTAYRFNFPEQHVLPKTLNVKEVSHRICFDSKFITRILAFLKKLGILNFLELKKLRNAVVKFLNNIHLGSDKFIVKVKAFGKKEGKTTDFEFSILGNNQTRITGKVAAIVAENIYTEKLSSGVYHIEEIFNLQDIIAQLNNDINFYFDDL